MKIKELKRLNYKELKLSHLRRKVMTINNIMYVVAKIMTRHKGIDNAISSDNLFYEVYGAKRNPDYIDDFRWDYIRRAMHKLRQRTKLFVANQRGANGDFFYFVPTTESEAQIYIDNIERNISRMRSMQRKAMKSVIDEWYKLDWIEESKDLTVLDEIYRKEKKQIKYGG
jgi:hypothetical protein